MKRYLINQRTKSITDVSTGTILFFGFEDFSEKVVKGGFCFICGAEPGSKPFNNEHVVPDWIIRSHNLHNDQVRLPNDTYIKYGSYKVPCCMECNSALSKSFEIPLSTLLKSGYVRLIEELHQSKELVQKLFQWMCLLFFKTHLKDTKLLMERNESIPAGSIGDYHKWGPIHHIHCMSRLFYSHAKVSDEVVGSLLVLPAVDQEDPFDYMDSMEGATVMIRLGDVCIMAVLNDSKFCQSLFHKYIEKFAGPLSEIQLREVFAHLVFLNQNLEVRPEYHSTLRDSEYFIYATLPEQPKLLPTSEQRSTVGELLYEYVRELVPKNVLERDNLLQSIKEGKLQFLFDEQGNFKYHGS